ncbi:hypothetical protein SAMN04490244_103152 [Tranquillimonas rosea]|uniref:Lipoprotein n=1 Tax=Tranquillimonas rosea TaxID=641238 RepID=A0A1H9SDL2_9RHOB|nr:hypothetical protein [Tranquillimonas rosea]SER82998.1 hypothetical protein SAMN04490244_103152 [Tranquillimonas rosea]
MPRRLARLLPLVPLLAACAGPSVNQPGAPAVRHFASTNVYEGGARWHLFVFDPAEPRSLDDRLALARSATAADPACRWVRAPRVEIEERTRAQGARYADTMLAAPLRCDA